MWAAGSVISYANTNHHPGKLYRIFTLFITKLQKNKMSRKISNLYLIRNWKSNISSKPKSTYTKPILNCLCIFCAKLEHVGPLPPGPATHQRISTNILLIGLNYAIMLPKIENSLTNYDIKIIRRARKCRKLGRKLQHQSVLFWQLLIKW